MDKIIISLLKEMKTKKKSITIISVQYIQKKSSLIKYCISMVNQICKNISETCTYFSITGISMNKFEYVNFIKEKDNKVL